MRAIPCFLVSLAMAFGSFGTASPAADQPQFLDFRLQFRDWLFEIKKVKVHGRGLPGGPR